ncbi:phage phieco32-like cooH.nH2 ligase-type [Caudoviricetes sp.]|nr:phage phieco32-like cooH.nH2 ligase-type [Caudoviricetes sp.]
MLTVGSDPECFLRSSKGRLVSSIGLLPGNKTYPFKTEHGSIQSDNILAEFNSLPSTNKEEFILNHKLVIKDLVDIIKPLDLKLDFISSAVCSNQLLSEPLARLAGCEPDYCAWTGLENRPPDYMNNNVRVAGGHLHISFLDSDGSLEDRLKFVRALDLVLGVPSVLLDSDVRRRELYGKAGAFRPKFTDRNDPYNGIEYRTLSNFWLKSESLMSFVWDGVERVYNSFKELSELATNLESLIVPTINNSDREMANRICNEYL